MRWPHHHMHKLVYTQYLDDKWHWNKIKKHGHHSEYDELMVCIWRHGGHVGGTTQKNMLLVTLSDPAGVGGWHCLPHPQRLIANQEYIATSQHWIRGSGYIFVPSESENSLLFVKYKALYPCKLAYFTSSNLFTLNLSLPSGLQVRIHARRSVNSSRKFLLNKILT